MGSENISFEKAPQIISLNPKTVIAAYPIEFNIKIETANGISEIYGKILPKYPFSEDRCRKG